MDVKSYSYLDHTVLILILCGVLQVGSNGLSFWAFRDGYQNLQEVETSNQQRSALAQTRAVLLQASTALNKAGTLTALSYPPEDIKALMVVARSSLKQADAQFKAFTAQEAVSEKEKALKVAMKKRPLMCVRRSRPSGDVAGEQPAF